MNEYTPKITHKCTCCAAEIEMIEQPEWLMTEFKGGMARMLAILLRARRRHEMVEMRELCTAMYDKKWADVPDHGAKMVWWMIRRYRPKLNSLGWEIAMPKHGRTDGFFLVAITPKGPFDHSLQRYRKGKARKMKYNKQFL